MTADTAVILGAGPCGLAAAWELTRRRRYAPLLLEREQQPGGLARTHGQGPYRVDLSIHRLHAHDPELARLLDSGALFDPGQDLHRVTRKSIHIHLAGALHAYPLRVGSLARLPARRVARVAAQYARRRLLDAAPRAATTYRQWFERTYGPELYGWVAGPLMGKQWGLPADRIGADLALHRRLSAGPRDLLRGLPLLSWLAPRAIAGSFVYGRQGSGALMQRMAAQIHHGGGRLRTGVTVARVLHRGGRIEQLELAGGERVPCAALVSTIPAASLVPLLDPAPPDEVLEHARALRFRDLMVVALPLRRERVSPDHVTYFPEARFPFTRIYEQKNASPEMIAAPGRTVLGFELPCFAGDGLWSMSDRDLLRWMTSFAADVGFEPGEAEPGWVIRAREAYPLYELGHDRHAAAVCGWFHGELDNALLVGRNSLHRLDNMHHALAMGFELARTLSEGGRGRTWQHALERFRHISYID